MSCFCSEGVADRLDIESLIAVKNTAQSFEFLIVHAWFGNASFMFSLRLTRLQKPPVESRLLRCSIVNLSISFLDILTSFH